MSVFLKFVVCFLVAVGASAGQADDPIVQIKGLLRDGNAAEADRRCDLALRLFPRNAALWTLKGLASDGLHQTGQALKAYDSALAIDREYLPALEGAAQDEFRKRSQKAVPLLERAEKVRPADFTIQAMLGTLAYLRHDCRKAVVYFERLAAVPQWSIGTLQEYGTCLGRLEEWKRATTVFSSALDRQPTNDEARYNLAIAEFQTGQYSSVVETLNPLLQRDPPDPESLGLAAEAFESLFDTPRAVDLLKKGIAAYPENPEFYVAFVNLSLAHSSFQVGVDVVNAGIARLPREASLHFARGILFLEMGENDKSERDFDLAEALDPAMPVGLAAGALAKLDLRQPREAERIVRTQLANRPDDPYLHYVLAEAIRSQGALPDSDEFRQALAAAEKAVKLQPNFALARLVLSRLYMQSGQFDRAATQAQEAIKLAPDNVTIMYNLILATNRTGRAEQLPQLVKRLNELKDASSRKRHQLRQYTLAERPPEDGPLQVP